MPDFTYRYLPEHVDLMKEQVWEARDDLTFYTTLAAKEFAQFEQHIGKPKVVMELGCGLGRGSVYLNWLLDDWHVMYVLADRQGRTDNSGAFAPMVDEFYNDFKMTHDFCSMNGIDGMMLFDTEKDLWEGLPNVDLFFSLCSFGMHVPIERYMDRLLSVSAPGATMIFGVRHPSYDENSFKDKFEEVIYIPGDHGTERSPCENWLILKNPRGKNG